jgi:hypothetical protein
MVLLLDLAAGTLPVLAQDAKRLPNELYFYPPFSADFQLHEFDPDRVVRNDTTDVSVVDGMSGIAIIIYWSQLCPTENQCNFEMIDRILAFWRERGKKVILAVSVIGSPMERVNAAGKTFASATPDWVLHKVATFQSPSNNFIGLFPDWKSLANNPSATFPFPRYDDARFVAEIRKLVRQLGERYDGNPTLAYVRIGAGKSSEDNPIGRTNGFGPGTGMPGFTNHLWTTYSREVAAAYFDSFHRTRLEFNFDWIAVIAAQVRNVTPVTPAEASEAQAFLAELQRRNVFLTFDGGPAPVKGVAGATAARPAGVICTGFGPEPSANMPATLAAPYAAVQRLEKMGIPFGLEIGALSDPCDTPATIAAILRFYRPERVIFFADTAAAIEFLHNGINARDSWEVQALTNAFIPFTNVADMPAHVQAATPEIKHFAGALEAAVEGFQRSGIR